ncbi:MAG TPA: zinc-binding alcohol dehydrogenase family protein [Acidobacteriaceae bacterium]|nr:zinc-binding alcohol dehydrogenase family protein [Acidobacteriaceae bacterium]
MNAAVVQSFDAPPRYQPFEEPVPRAGERLVTVTAAGLHPIVKALASGAHYGSTAAPPFVAGVDGVGRLDDNSRVYFGIVRAPYGSFAERALAPDSMCIPLPEGLDDATAAGTANPAMSSWVALKTRARFVPGESVLVLGATGIAGHLAVQIAKQMGAHRVIACGRNPQALEEVRDLGADAIVSLDQQHDALVAALRSEIASGGVDVVLDYLWGPPAQATLEALAQKSLSATAPRVRYVQIGSSAGGTIPLPAATLRSSGLELLGSGFGSASLEQIRTAIAEFFAVAAVHPLRTSVTTAPLREVESLWNARESARLVFLP